MIRIANRVLVALVWVLATLAPAMAWAQSVAPSPTLRKVAPIWAGYLIMFVLLAIVMAISLMPSKRTHQD